MGAHISAQLYTYFLPSVTLNIFPINTLTGILTKISYDRDLGCFSMTMARTWLSWFTVALEWGRHLEAIFCCNNQHQVDMLAVFTEWSSHSLAFENIFRIFFMFLLVLPQSFPQTECLQFAQLEIQSNTLSLPQNSWKLFFWKTYVISLRQVDMVGKSWDSESFKADFSLRLTEWKTRQPVMEDENSKSSTLSLLSEWIAFYYIDKDGENHVKWISSNVRLLD